MANYKITEEGLERLNEKISTMEDIVKDIQEEKAIAYNLSGDGWHDNPGFNHLEQKEFQAVKELQALKNRRDTSQLIKIEKRNTHSIQIGSIVKLEQYFYKNKTTKLTTWEIVGYQESDIKLNRIAYDTPVGSALFGRKKGETIEISLPIGKVKFKILDLLENWEDK
jgi:transcription elongation GreA/GreB family factor